MLKRLSMYLLIIALVAMPLFITACSEKKGGEVLGPDMSQPPDNSGNPGTINMRLSADPYQAVELEAKRALSYATNGTSSRVIGGYWAGDYNYIASDPSALEKIRNFYGEGLCTVWYGWPSFWRNADYYGYMSQKYGGGNWYAKVGHGGQCRFFANLVIYRSGAYRASNGFLESYQTYINDYFSGVRAKTKPSFEARPGDVIQTTVKDGHTAVVIGVPYRDSMGRATALDVIDSNFVGGKNNEIIGRHIITNLGSYIALKLAYQ